MPCKQIYFYHCSDVTSQWGDRPVWAPVKPPTPVTNMSAHSLAFKNDFGWDMPHRIPALTYIIWMCLWHSASYRYIHSRLRANGQNRTNSIACMINICVQTCHSIRRRTEAGQHARAKKNEKDEKFLPHTDSSSRAVSSRRDMKQCEEPLVPEMMICNVMFVILIYGVLWRMRKSVTIRRRIQLTNHNTPLRVISTQSGSDETRMKVKCTMMC